MKKRVFQLFAISAFCFSLTAVSINSLQGQECVRKFQYVKDAKRKFLSSNCKTKTGEWCKQKTQGCPPRIGNISIG